MTRSSPAASASWASCTILAINTTAEQRLLGQADPPAIRRMSEDLRNLLLAIEGPALDEHPYEPCQVPKHDKGQREATQP